MKNTNSKPNGRYAELIKQSPEIQAAIEDAQLSIDISMQISRLRQEAGLTQKQLAILAHLQQSNISRLESPGYQGYTLKVLSRVVRALRAKLRIEIIRPTITATNRHSFYSMGRNISSLKPPTTAVRTEWLGERESFANDLTEVIHV